MKSPRDELPMPRFGLMSATALVVASMIGTGVFTTTGFLVSALNSPLAVLAAWIAGGLIAAAGALLYAELSAALPRNGGEYQLLSRIYHPAAGFAAGVISLVVGFAAPVAASALAFGHYLSAALPGVPSLTAAVGVIVLFAGAHGIDVRWGSRAQTALTATQVALIACMTVTGLVLGHPGRVVAPNSRAPLEAVASPESRSPWCSCRSRTAAGTARPTSPGRSVLLHGRCRSHS